MHTDAAEQVFRDRSSALSAGPVIIRASPETLRANIPVELQQIRQWLPWKLEMRGDKARKVPVGRNLRNVDSGDRAHWLSFEDSLRLLERQTDITGVGFVLSADDGIVAVDIDWKNCVGLDESLQPTRFQIKLKPGSNTAMTVRFYSTEVVQAVEASATFEQTRAYHARIVRIERKRRKDAMPKIIDLNNGDMTDNVANHRPLAEDMPDWIRDAPYLWPPGSCGIPVVSPPLSAQANDMMIPESFG